MTITEQEEVDAVLGNIVQSDVDEEEGDEGDDDENTDNSTADSGGTSTDSQASGGAFYVVDPDTGELKDPTTGEVAEVENIFSDDNVDNADTGNSDTNVNN
jgi:hypothetical protein